MSSSAGNEGTSAYGNGAPASADELAKLVLASESFVVSSAPAAASFCAPTKSKPLTLEAYSRLCVSGSRGS